VIAVLALQAPAITGQVQQRLPGWHPRGVPQELRGLLMHGSALQILEGDIECSLRRFHGRSRRFLPNPRVTFRIIGTAISGCGRPLSLPAGLFLSSHCDNEYLMPWSIQTEIAESEIAVDAGRLAVAALRVITST
jgi:hypothetical protein